MARVTPKPGPAQGPLSKQEFASLKFRVFNQVAANRALPPHAARLVILLSQYLDAKNNSWGWTYHEHLAELLGVERQCVTLTIKALVKYGHLETRRQGQHRPNLYRLTPVEASRCTPERTSEEASSCTPQRISENPDVRSDTSQMHAGAYTESVHYPGRGNDKDAEPAAGASKLGPASAAAEEKVAASGIGAAADADFGRLAAAWVRPYGSEPEAVLRHAYAAARETGSAADILCCRQEVACCQCGI
jgi:hypothetical protein